MHGHSFPSTIWPQDVVKRAQQDPHMVFDRLTFPCGKPCVMLDGWLLPVASIVFLPLQDFSCALSAGLWFSLLYLLFFLLFWCGTKVQVVKVCESEKISTGFLNGGTLGFFSLENIESTAFWLDRVRLSREESITTSPRVMIPARARFGLTTFSSFVECPSLSASSKKLVLEYIFHAESFLKRIFFLWLLFLDLFFRLNCLGRLQRLWLWLVCSWFGLRRGWLPFLNKSLLSFHRLIHLCGLLLL